MSKLEELRSNAFVGWWSVEDLSEINSKLYEVFYAGWDALASLIGNDHNVVFDNEDEWIIEHSIECRLSGEMSRCPFHEAIYRMTTLTYGFNPELKGRWIIRDPGDDRTAPTLEMVVT